MFILNEYKALIDKQTMCEIVADCDTFGLFEAALINAATEMQPQVLRRENTYKEAAEHQVCYMNEVRLESDGYKVVVVGLQCPDGFEDYGLFDNSLKDIYISLKT